MWQVKGNDIQMTEGDYGVVLPIVISGVTLGEYDSVRVTIKDKINGTTHFEKDFAGLVNNTVPVSLTQADTDQLPVGGYVYALDWYQSGAFMCNLIPRASWRVVDKA